MVDNGTQNRIMDAEEQLSWCNATDDNKFRCPFTDKLVQIRNIYPPIQELQPRVLCVVIIFVVCFVVGICGNASVWTIIRGILNERKTSRLTPRRNGDNAILYIAALCVVDFLMSLSLPPAILDSIIGFWMFGTGICKLHHICGSVGRIVSTFLITAMSFDRFMAVCHPYKQFYRSKKFVICTIITLWIAAFILLFPMLAYAKAHEIPVHHIFHNDTNLNFTSITRVRVYKCTDMMPTYLFLWFTSSTFLLGHVVPLILIVFFNYKLISKLYRHTKIIPRSGIPLRRISIYTILIAVVYFVCWTPYWCSVLYAIYNNFYKKQEQANDTLLFLIYCVHLLPYFGSASNWILYGLLNTQLQLKHDNGGDETHVTMMTANTNITAGTGTGKNEQTSARIDRSSSMIDTSKMRNGLNVNMRQCDGIAPCTSLTSMNNNNDLSEAEL